jgi:hypothetical protein
MRFVRVALIVLCLAFGGLAGCSESEDSPPDDSFGDTTEKDRAGLVEVGRAMSGFGHEYAVYARHAEQNDSRGRAEALDRMARAVDRAKSVSFDSREARRAVAAYLGSMRRFVTRNTRLERLLSDPTSKDEAVNDGVRLVGTAAAAAQRANRQLSMRALATVTGERRRELARAFGRVHRQLLRETDPEAYRRLTR